jgi:hypothetical protein
MASTIINPARKIIIARNKGNFALKEISRSKKRRAIVRRIGMII